MESTPQHTYQILTKRPDRMAKITQALRLLPNVWLTFVSDCRDAKCAMVHANFSVPAVAQGDVPASVEIVK
jgi:protein gp37